MGSFSIWHWLILLLPLIVVGAVILIVRSIFK